MLRLTYSFPNDSPPPNLKAELDRATGDIRGYLQHLQENGKTFAAQLPALVRSEIQERSKQFSNRAGVLSSLGLPRSVHAPTTGHEVETIANQPAPSAQARPQAAVRVQTARTSWTVFVSHASEDKQTIAKPLADALIASGLSVWYDEYSLKVGDSLRRKIDDGLAQSQFGIVILSRSFFGKHWPEQELNGLFAREIDGKKVILPVWHDVSRDEVLKASPILADRLGVPTSLGLEQVVAELRRAMESD